MERYLPAISLLGLALAVAMLLAVLWPWILYGVITYREPVAPVAMRNIPRADAVVY